MATNSIKLLTGNSHPQLAKQVADRLGIELAKTMSLNYSNQETSVTVGESVRDEDGMFVIFLLGFGAGEGKEVEMLVLMLTTSTILTTFNANAHFVYSFYPPIHSTG
jgi:ribose-phosphate pyrophosphokinase